MKHTDEANHFLFNEETHFVELLIMSKMESEEAYDKLKTKVVETIKTMYTEREKGNFFLYILEEKGKTFSRGYERLKLGFSLGGYDFDAINAFTYSEFIKNLRFRVTYDVKNPANKGIQPPTEVYDFPLVTKGLLNAIEKFNLIAQTNNLQLIGEEKIHLQEIWKQRVVNLMSK